MGWSCGACTFKNINSISKCFTCGTTKREKNESIDLTEEMEEQAPPPAKKKRSAGTQQTLLFGAKTKKAKIPSNNDTVAPPRQSSSSTQSTLAGTTKLSTASYRKISEDGYPFRKTRCERVLREVFHIDKLRYQQPNAVECALQGKSQIVVMATGGGKSTFLSVWVGREYADDLTCFILLSSRSMLSASSGCVWWYHGREFICSHSVSPSSLSFLSFYFEKLIHITNHSCLSHAY